MIDKYEAFDGRELGGETRVLGGNLPQCHLAHHKSHMTGPGIKLKQPCWEANN
jgi:hypothetical protein